MHHAFLAAYNDRATPKASSIFDEALHQNRVGLQQRVDLQHVNNNFY